MSAILLNGGKIKGTGNTVEAAAVLAFLSTATLQLQAGAVIEAQAEHIIALLNLLGTEGKGKIAVCTDSGWVLLDPGTNGYQLVTDSGETSGLKWAAPGSDSSKAPIDSPTFTGTPAAPTPSEGDNSTKLATTAYADRAACHSNQNTQSGDYTLVLADQFKTLLMTSGSANVLTIPPNTDVALPVGTRIPGWTTGAGQTTITPGSGVTVNSRGGALLSAGQYAGWMLEKTATNTWLTTGDLTS